MNETRNAQDPVTPTPEPSTPESTPSEPVAGAPEPDDESRRTIEQLKDQLLRKAAEFENYKRRSEADTVSIVRFANERLLKALLPVLDDFDRSLKAGREKGADDPFFRGVELVALKLMKVMMQEGLEPFTSVGEPFDVGLHDALLQLPRADVPPHTVVEEVERGYRLNEKVLRHAKVVVSAAPEDGPEQAKEEHG
jgi:molecular chaperone GrpE